MEKWKLEKRVIDLICSIFHHGDFKAETPNEKELEQILGDLGMWPTNEGSIIKNTDWWLKEKEKEKSETSTEEGIDYSNIGKTVMYRKKWLENELNNVEKDSNSYKSINELLEEANFVIQLTNEHYGK